MIDPYLTGLGVGAGLIIAIGAQNAFVLSQGIRRTSLLIVPLVCSLSDALLITLGIAGVGTLLSINPIVLKFATAGGALFLIWYGLRSFQSFLKKGRLEEQETLRMELGEMVAYTLAVIFLNPHVYLDTMLFVGSISTQFYDGGRIYFVAGAVSASFLWFLPSAGVAGCWHRSSKILLPGRFLISPEHLLCGI